MTPMEICFLFTSLYPPKEKKSRIKIFDGPLSHHLCLCFPGKLP